MALIPEHHILDHIQQLIRREGQGHRESHRFANAVQNDVILTYRLRELRLRSQERPRRRGATRPGRAPQPRRASSDEPHEPYENAPDEEDAGPEPKRRRRTRQSEGDS